jgi:hypothetical protein
MSILSCLLQAQMSVSTTPLHDRLARGRPQPVPSPVPSVPPPVPPAPPPFSLRARIAEARRTQC